MARNNLQVCDQNICIFTLGKFHISQDNQVLTESSSRSKKMWEIFKFLLSNRGKTFFPEDILEKIWPENDYADPSMIMRAQIFRLRQAFSNKDKKTSLAHNIVLSRGCYSWEDNVEYWLDVDALESLANNAGLLVDSNPDEAIMLFRKALALYNGHYLPDLSFSEWIEPIRSYYRDIYMDCLFDLINLLKARKKNSEIIKLCEQAAAIDYFEEKIHTSLIEALLAEGHITRARTHYNEVTTIFYRELGIKPSDHLKGLYRLVGTEPGSFELDLSTIQEGLKGKEAESGAYFCDAELFRYFYNLERARVERSGQSVLLGLFTLTAPNYILPDKNILNEVMHNLQEVTLDSLRKGDLVTRWNDAQLLLLLPGLNREQSDMVIERIEKNFLKLYSLRGLKLHKKIESILPLENDAHFY